MLVMPSFIDSPFFRIEDGEDETAWVLDEGAPDDVRREYDEYMRQAREDEARGVVA